MTPDLSRFIQNLSVVLGRLSYEHLYQLALGLRHELARRDVDCVPEADALVAALLAHARIEHRAIYSQNCPGEPTRTADGSPGIGRVFV